MLIEKINSPADLKKLSVKELNALAEELRGELIDVISKNGGHLSSNLGVVELTVSLHFLFDSPADRILWDVGHQSYVHKLLTGRRERFGTLRQFGGLSGFPNPAESAHDAFVAATRATRSPRRSASRRRKRAGAAAATRSPSSATAVSPTG